MSNRTSNDVVMCRDPEKRPTAKEALEHPWLAAGSTADRSKGPPLHRTVVQRIQARRSSPLCATALLATNFHQSESEKLKMTQIIALANTGMLQMLMLQTANNGSMAGAGPTSGSFSDTALLQKLCSAGGFTD